MSGEVMGTNRPTGFGGKRALAAWSIGAALLLGCGGNEGESLGPLRNASDLNVHPLGEFVELDSEVFVNIQSVEWELPPPDSAGDHIYVAVLSVRVENRSDGARPGLYFGVRCDDPNRSGAGMGEEYDGSQALPPKSFAEGKYSVRYHSGCEHPRVITAFYAGGLGGRNLFFPVQPPAGVQ